MPQHSEGPSSDRPNILLVMTDQQRWDALAAAGTFPVETPALDRLMADGVWFRRTYTQSPLCVPARISLLTGRYPHQHGCVNNGHFVWPEAPSFVRELRDGAGYRTGNIGKLHFTWRHDMELLTSNLLLEEMGFAEPLETTGKMSRGNLRASAYSEHLRAKGLLRKFHTDLVRRADAGPVGGSYASVLDADDHIDGWVMGRAQEWLEDVDTSKPFFYWVGPEGPHDPFDPPEPYASMYDPADMPLGPLDYRYPAGDRGGFGKLPDAMPEEIQRMRAAYLGNVSFIDAWLGQLMDTLEDRGLLDNTWIFFTSDHGEFLGDHRRWGKLEFFESTVRVPLIVRPPHGAGLAGGVTRDALAELIDVSATMLDIAGVDMSGHQGRSLLPLFEPDADDVHREFVTSQVTQRFMICDGTRKLEVGPDGAVVHAFDLGEDPYEEDDLAAGVPPPWVAELVERAKQFRADTPDDMPPPWKEVPTLSAWGRNPLREYAARGNE